MLWEIREWHEEDQNGQILAPAENQAFKRIAISAISNFSQRDR